jgi:hypothetical protein
MCQFKQITFHEKARTSIPHHHMMNIKRKHSPPLTTFEPCNIIINFLQNIAILVKRD